MNKNKTNKNSKSPVVGIIGGTGRMGQWMKNFFESRGLTVLVSGRSTQITAVQLAKKSDIVIASVPIAEVQQVIKSVIPHLKSTALLTDLTSLKVIPLEAMEDAKCATLGMHPLFGPSVSSPFGQKIVFCKQKDNTYVSYLKTMFKEAGMDVIEMTADEHDYHMAYIQALTHAINLMLVKTFLEEERILSPKLMTPMFTLQSLVMGRVLQQDLDLMANIQIYNPYFAPILHTLLAQGNKLAKIIEKYDKEGFQRLFEKEQQYAKRFAPFSAQQTDKLLRMVDETPATLPVKTTISNLPKKGTVSYLGPEGTYSHKGTQMIFPTNSFKKIPCDNIFEIFMKVHEGDSNFGVVPAENSIEGVVKGTLDYLLDFSLVVCGSFALPIHHMLLSKEKKLESIHTVISHPQALAQCQSWIRSHLPKVKIIAASSTASALQDVKNGYGYIGSEEAAKKYKLHVLAKSIEDLKDNATRFYIIAKHPFRFKGLSNKKTLLFVTVYNRVGILKDILTILANYSINLTKLESRPSREKIWDYHFFMEVEAKETDENFIKALKELENYCPIIRILGQT